MALKVTLNDGNSISVDANSFNAAVIAEELNKSSIFTLNIGNLVINKNVISSLHLETQEGAQNNVSVLLNNGTNLNTVVENYNSKDVSLELNKRLQFFSIGNVVIDKREFRLISDI
ncbi:hypothetical protein [Bacillus mesophilum]|uniref:Uncharacterized protein n=1 Tax=Bacillus mesophilum TaxID=1071718 RepID=A0A7V7RNT9_9BACI|nr:hypothetical protein [Bacillus mesophilum]KAB2334253.1 hypothetical protein F7732_09285 [Bacillus mesophilum]